MNRVLLQSPSFIRSAKRFLKNNPNMAANLENTLHLLSEDAFHPTLKTHKLKGNLSNYWASSITYELRILFEFVEHDGKQAILLGMVGTHDEVY